MDEVVLQVDTSTTVLTEPVASRLAWCRFLQRALNWNQLSGGGDEQLQSKLSLFFDWAFANPDEADLTDYDKIAHRYHTQSSSQQLKKASLAAARSQRKQDKRKKKEERREAAARKKKVMERRDR
eukprot:scpid81410/ scgid17153/ 